MAVVPVAAVSAGVSSAGGNITFDLSGAGLQDGDLVLFFVGNDAGTANTLTPPASITDPIVRDDNDAGGFTQRVRCYRKTWHTGDPTSYAFALQAGAAGVGIAQVCRGQDPGTPIDNSSGNQDVSGDLVVETTSVNATVAGDLAVVMNWGDNFGANTAVTIALEGTLTPSVQNARPPTDTTCVMSVGTVSLAGTGASGTKNGAFSAGSLASIGQIILVKAPPGAGPAPQPPALMTLRPGPLFPPMTAAPEMPAPAPAAGLTAAIAQALETDTAGALLGAKAKALGLVTETDTAQPLGRAKRLAIAIATENDLAQTLGRVKARIIGLASETDTAQPVFVRPLKAAIGLATETDTAFAFARSKARALVRAIEIDTAGAFLARKARAIAQALETDTALGLGRRKARTLGLASETDTAQPLGRRKAKVLGFATETDAAFSFGTVTNGSISFVLETDTARPMTRGKAKPLGRASELDTAQTLTRAKRAPIGQASEVDTARPLGRLRTRAIVAAVEADSALPFGRRKFKTIGAATETDTAFALVGVGGLQVVNLEISDRATRYRLVVADRVTLRLEAVDRPTRYVLRHADRRIP